MKSQATYFLRVTAVFLFLAILWSPFLAGARAADALKLYVAGLKPNETIPQKFLSHRRPCSGRDLSPEISWRSIPKQAKSFAFVVWDQDAPKQGGFYHWVLINIPPSVNTLPEGAGNVLTKRTPSGAVQLINDWGEPGYGGPCPPGGKPHHYHFKVYALTVDQLSMDQNTKTADAVAQITNSSLASSELVLVYGR